MFWDTNFTNFHELEMAKLKTVKVAYNGAVGNEVVFKYDVYVDQEGCFTTTRPEDVVEKLTKAKIELEMNHRATRFGFFSASTLDGLQDAISGKIKEYLSRELISEEVVIRYSINTTCSYAINDKNEIVPNCGWLKGGSGADWKQGTVEHNANNRAAYGFNIYTDPSIKRVYGFKSGAQKTEYVGLHEELKMTGKQVKMGKYLKWLDGVVAMDPSNYGKNMQEILYTEEVAEFFVGLLTSVCRINEKIKDLLDPASIKKIAESGMKFLE